MFYGLKSDRIELMLVLLIDQELMRVYIRVYVSKDQINVTCGRGLQITMTFHSHRLFQIDIFVKRSKSAN